MSYFYLDPARELETYACPDAEVFHVKAGDWWHDSNGERCDEPTVYAPCGDEGTTWDAEREAFVCHCPSKNVFEVTERPCEAGWYWWACLPGCLPDSEPNGPFETAQAAIDDAQEGAES